MKRNFFLALMVTALLALPAARVFAAGPAAAGAPQCPPNSGCACDVWDMLKNHADAKRSEANAVAKEIIRKPEPVANLTCLDQQLKLTAHLGSLFSDKQISGTASHDLFCGLKASISGSAKATLSAHLGDIVLPSLGNLLGALGIPTGFGLPNTNFSICAPTLSVPKITLPTLHLPGPLGACLPSIGGQSVGGQSIGGQCASLALPTIDCKAIDKLWKKAGAATGGAVSIEGAGASSGAPYTSFADLVSGIPAGVGVDFKTQLGSDSGILSKALGDLTNLSGPGNIPSWPKTPTLPAGASTKTIIDSM